MKRSNNKVVYTYLMFGIACSASLIVPNRSFAQSDSSGSGAKANSISSSNAGRDTSADDELLLADDTVVTTVTKTAERISDSPAAVTVITEDEIRNSGATSIPELLRSVPGVDVEEPNASQVNVSIRGFNQVFANKLLVMVDGRSIYQELYGVVFWNTEPLLISRIKRIEIVRGPGSVLYGANAFGGVINIITKTPAEMANGQASTTFKAAGGEQNSNSDEVTFSDGDNRGWSSTLGLGYHSTDGFMSQSPNNSHDSSRVPILSFDAQKQVSRGSLNFSAANSDAKTDLLSEIYLSDAGFHTSDAMLSYVEDRGPNPITARIYGNFFRLAAPNFYVATTSYNAELQQQRNLSPTNTLVYGASYRQSSFIATPTGSERRTETLSGYYLQDQARLGLSTNLFAGVRWDHNSIYGAQVSPRISLVQHLQGNQSVRVSYGTAFRAPSDIETYLNEALPIQPGFNETLLGNTSLRPEQITSTEIGYRRDLQGGYIGASIFDNDVSNEIVASPTIFAPSPPFPAGTPSTVQYIDAGTARATGLELEGGFTLCKSLKGLLNYSYEDVVNTTTHTPADFSPHNKVNLVLNDSLGSKWSAYAAMHYVGSQTSSDNGAAIETIGSYTTVDARLGYKIVSGLRPWTISVSATNLFNDEHREIPADSLNASNGESLSAILGRTAWVSIDAKL